MKTRKRVLWIWAVLVAIPALGFARMYYSGAMPSEFPILLFTSKEIPTHPLVFVPLILISAFITALVLERLSRVFRGAKD